ncbi:hypothetical protein SRO_5009 [Streptomyces rochei]|nr:hypothetical protein SRO_5009 [Streptomyces rochei]
MPTRKGLQAPGDGGICTATAFTNSRKPARSHHRPAERAAPGRRAQRGDSGEARPSSRMTISAPSIEVRRTLDTILDGTVSARGPGSKSCSERLNGARPGRVAVPVLTLPQIETVLR